MPRQRLVWAGPQTRSRRAGSALSRRCSRARLDAVTLGHCQDPAAALGKIVDDIARNRTQTAAQDGFRCAEDD